MQFRQKGTMPKQGRFDLVWFGLVTLPNQAQPNQNYPINVKCLLQAFYIDRTCFIFEETVPFRLSQSMWNAYKYFTLIGQF